MAAAWTGRRQWNCCAPARDNILCSSNCAKSPGCGIRSTRSLVSSISSKRFNLQMPERTTIAAIQAGRHTDETVEIAGWLYNLRKSGKIVFPIVRDGAGLIQCVAVKAALPEDVFETIKGLTQESAIVVTGKIRAEARAHGGFEMDVEGVQVVQRVSESD